MTKFSVTKDSGLLSWSRIFDTRDEAEHLYHREVKAGAPERAVLTLGEHLEEDGVVTVRTLLAAYFTAAGPFELFKEEAT